MVLLSKLEETLFIDGKGFDLSANRYPGDASPQPYMIPNGLKKGFAFRPLEVIDMEKPGTDGTFPRI